MTGERVFQGVGGGSERIEVFEKMLTGSPFLSSRRFSLVLYAHSLFSLGRTDRETGIINEVPWCYLWCNGVQIKKNSSFRVSAFPFLIDVMFHSILVRLITELSKLTDFPAFKTFEFPGHFRPIRR